MLVGPAPPAALDVRHQLVLEFLQRCSQPPLLRTSSSQKLHYRLLPGPDDISSATLPLNSLIVVKASLFNHLRAPDVNRGIHLLRAFHSRREASACLRLSTYYFLAPEHFTSFPTNLNLLNQPTRAQWQPQICRRAPRSLRLPVLLPLNGMLILVGIRVRN